MLCCISVSLNDFFQISNKHTDEWNLNTICQHQFADKYFSITCRILPGAWRCDL